MLRSLNAAGVRYLVVGGSAEIFPVARPVGGAFRLIDIFTAQNRRGFTPEIDPNRIDTDLEEYLRFDELRHTDLPGRGAEIAKCGHERFGVRLDRLNPDVEILRVERLVVDHPGVPAHHEITHARRVQAA